MSVRRARHVSMHDIVKDLVRNTLPNMGRCIYGLMKQTKLDLENNHF